MISLKEHWLREGFEKGFEKGLAMVLSDFLPLLYDEYSPEAFRIEELSESRLEELLIALKSRSPWEQIQRLLANGQEERIG